MTKTSGTCLTWSSFFTKAFTVSSCENGWRHSLKVASTYQVLPLLRISNCWLEIRFIYNLVATSSYKFGVIEYGIISNITTDYILGSVITITLHEISRTFNLAATSAIEVNIAINRMHISSRLDHEENKIFTTFVTQC